MLKMDNVQVYYGNIQALQNVSLEVAQGEIVTLIGANGAGKTTTLKAISGLLHSKSGKIEFLGKRIDNLTTAEIVKLGISQCPEGRGIWSDMTVLENLEMGAYVRKDKKGIKKDFEQVYAYFPVLEERKNQLAGSLSGGEQQMLAMGRALMSRPRLFLLDEPSLGLAPILVKEVADIIKKIHREGTTVLLVEQNAFLALNISNRAYVLETGKIALEGKAKDLLQDERVKKAYLGMG
ncbi:ABC transporter ATP-binding protein [Candidatus Atribacteria bacterium HGW-Atribacteria-1]|nr:MAG: ABC transporter ATP-binding protein [Candidatus Atribacteria bacterium HGW-Atribacteria-1]